MNIQIERMEKHLEHLDTVQKRADKEKSQHPETFRKTEGSGQIDHFVQAETVGAKNHAMIGFARNMVDSLYSGK